MGTVMEAKFRCDRVSQTVYGDEIEFAPVSDNGIPENKRYHEATPSGKIVITVTNPKLRGYYKPGKSYYVTMTEASE